MSPIGEKHQPGVYILECRGVMVEVVFLIIGRPTKGKNEYPADPKNAVIDIADINKYEISKVANNIAKLGHEVAEQTDIQRSEGGYSTDQYYKSHEGAGVGAENEISGATRQDVNGIAPTSNLQQVGRSPQGRPLYSGWKDIRYIKMESL